MQNTTKKTGKKTLGSQNENEYLELIKAFPPCPIASEEELIATQNIIDSLIDREHLTAAEQDYLNVLGSLVRDYEEIHHPIPILDGIELLKALLVEFNLQTQDLIPIFKTESEVSEVLSGRHEPTVNQIQRLAEFFNISPTDFLSPNLNSKR